MVNQNDSVRSCRCDSKTWVYAFGVILTIFSGLALTLYVLLITVFSYGFSKESEADKFSNALLHLRIGILIFASAMGLAGGITLIVGARKDNLRTVKMSMVLQLLCLLLTIVEILVGNLIDGGYEMEMFDMFPEICGIFVIVCTIGMTNYVYFKRIQDTETAPSTGTPL